MQNGIRGLGLIPAILLSVMALTGCGQLQPSNAVDAQGSARTGPRIVLTPTSGASNSPLTIDGFGFPPTAHIQIGFSSMSETHDPVQIGEVIASADGQFKLIFMIPQNWQDGALIIDDSLSITAASSDRSISTSAVFNVASTPGVTPSATKSAAGGQQPAGRNLPAVVIAPTGGTARTSVTVRGTGFPSSVEVVIRLGLPGSGAMSQVYASTVSDTAGNVTVVFLMPAAWPDGKPIVEKRLAIVAVTTDGSARALAEFAYNQMNETGSPNSPVELTASAASSQTTSPPLTTSRPIVKPEGTAGFSQEPINVTVDFLNSLLRDPSGASSVTYLSQRLHAEISANWILPTGLGIQPGYNSFEVTLFSNSPDSVVIQAALTYESGASIRNFTMIKEAGTWRIDKVVSGSK